MDLSKRRISYSKAKLEKEDLTSDPFLLFEGWMTHALEEDIPEPYAMSLATSDENNLPSIRTVLLRAFDPNGFIFYTNYNSQKGQDLLKNPQAALLFFWPALERQVRIQGKIEKVSAEDSDRYWNSRPEKSRLSSKASPQSQVLASRDELNQQMEDLDSRQDLSRPEHWGGYILSPIKFEFWQGRPGRMHDRFRYFKENTGSNNSWKIERLAP